MLPVLKFNPYFKSVIWGGSRIARFKGIPSQGDDIGESWELSPMPGHESVVSDGEFKGMTLNELVARYPAEILGKKVDAKWHGNFPLLVKFIDSNDDLSIQVHPDDALARERHNSLGKTEMWYSILPSEGAYLYAGFNREMTPDKFRAMIADNTIVSALGKFFVKPGDVFFLPAGRVHAIGKGNLLVEIQEASDITYRIYDYDRRDAQGNPRELHVEQSVGAVNYNDVGQEAKNIVPENGATIEVERCEYFTTSVSDVNGTLDLDLAPLDSFTILIGLSGSLTVTDPEGRTTLLPAGQTLLVPASIPSLRIEGKGHLMTVNL